MFRMNDDDQWPAAGPADALIEESYISVLGVGGGQLSKAKCNFTVDCCWAGTLSVPLSIYWTSI